jgi:transposase-like protein
MQRPTRVRRPHHTAAQRNEILATYQRSRLTQKEFAIQAGIGCSTLAAWRRQAATTKLPGPPAFVPVPSLFPAAAPHLAYRIEFPRGVIVEVASGFQSEELGALLRRVQAL